MALLGEGSWENEDEEGDLLFMEPQPVHVSRVVEVVTVVELRWWRTAAESKPDSSTS